MEKTTLRRTIAGMLAFVLMGVACVALAGCSDGKGTPSSSGGIETVDAEGVAIIGLDYAAGTGYEWHCTLPDDNPQVLVIADEGDKDLADDSDEPIDGGPMRHSVVLRAANPGTAELVCELVRPWEENEDPAEVQVYSFTVDNDLQITFNAKDSVYENEPEWGSDS